jgi:hypothetical protein
MVAISFFTYTGCPVPFALINNRSPKRNSDGVPSDHASGCILVALHTMAIGVGAIRRDIFVPIEYSLYR